MANLVDKIGRKSVVQVMLLASFGAGIIGGSSYNPFSSESSNETKENAEIASDLREFLGDQPGDNYSVEENFLGQARNTVGYEIEGRVSKDNAIILQKSYHTVGQKQNSKEFSITMRDEKPYGPSKEDFTFTSTVKDEETISTYPYQHLKENQKEEFWNFYNESARKLMSHGNFKDY